MSGRQLSADIISLIHHVHLNEAGWWRKAVGQVVKAVFWNQTKPLSPANAAEEFRRLVGISISELDLRKHLDLLVSQGILGDGASGFYLRDHARREMDTSHALACREQDECRATFIRICEEKCSSLHSEEVWKAFSKALAHAVRIAGANLFHLLAGDRLLREIDWAALLLNSFDPDQREGLRSLLAEFLGGSGGVCRSVILRHLSAHFFAEAAQLDPQTIKAVENGKRRRQIKVIFDTNFVFSILDLHDNPGDDSAMSLLKLAQSGGHQLEIKLYVLPGTLEEAQRTLLYQQRLVERVRARPNIARAALGSPLPSIARKYFATAAQVEGLSADAYFGPYISDLRTILKGKGIHVLEINTEVFHKRQDVIDDTLGEQERENSEVTEARRKGYDKILHDVVLWHAVNDRRLGIAADPLDMEYWGVTVDWSLIGFDRRKRGQGASSLPVVLHPSNLVQLMQFWVPRTETLEDGLVDAFRLPLLFQSFDPADEKATIKVLEAISRFENVDDLPEPTLRLVLANKALRARLKEAAASNDEVFELVREELITEHREALARLDETKGKLGQTESLLAQKENVLTVTQRQLLESGQERSGAEEEAVRFRDELRDSRAEIEDRKTIELNLIATMVSQQKTLFFLKFILFPVLLGVALAITCFTVTENGLIQGLARPLLVFAASVAPLAVALCLVPWYLRKRGDLSGWWPARISAWIGRKFVVLPIGLALAAVFQGAVWDSVKQAAGWEPAKKHLPSSEAARSSIPNGNKG